MHRPCGEAKAKHSFDQLSGFVIGQVDTKALDPVFVDAQDHVWVTHLPEMLTPEETAAVQDPPIGMCCVPAPVVIEFDAEGRVVQGWGDPSTQDVSEFPRNAHGLFVDHNDNVWIGSYRHHRVMKFTRSGELLLQLGEYDVTGGSNDPDLLGGPAGIWVDPANNEVFVADGYRNQRVVVYNGDTGAYLRHWGAYGDAPDDAYDFGAASMSSYASFSIMPLRNIARNRYDTMRNTISPGSAGFASRSSMYTVRTLSFSRLSFVSR